MIVLFLQYNYSVHFLAAVARVIPFIAKLTFPYNPSFNEAWRLKVFVVGVGERIRFTQKAITDKERLPMSG